MANTVIEPIDLATLVTQIHHMMQTMDGQAIASDQWSEMIDRMVGFRNLQEDWDGMGAKAPQATLIDTAVELALNLRQHGFPPPSRVGAGPDGEILLEWQDDHLYLEAEVCAPHSAEWMLAIDDGSPKHRITRQ